MAVVIAIVVIVTVGFIGHAIVTFMFARSDEGQVQTRGHELGYW